MNRLQVFSLLLIFLLAMTSAALAQGPMYTVRHWSFNSLGMSSGGRYRLNAVAGQPEVGVPLVGPGYTLLGGLRPGAWAGDERIYLPLVSSNR